MNLKSKILSHNHRWEIDAVYSVRTIDSFLWAVKNDCPEITKKHRNGGTIEYIQCAAAFDIETTSTEIDGKKIAFMYVWQFGINGYIIMGHTWREFCYLMFRLKSAMHTGDDRKLFIYVHNLAYEFQFMRFWFSWRDVFALKSLTPLSAELDGYGIIFRCSYLLTGCSLRMLADKIGIDEIKKRVGDLDYSLIHTPATLLTDAEKGYCIMDIVVIMVYIAGCIDDENGIENVPRTKTGYVRRRCRDGVLYHPEIEDENKRKRAMFSHRKLMQSLTLDPAEYTLIRNAFSGGFTHANCFHVGDICDDVTSYDFSSSYPAVMVMDYFPMSRGRLELVPDEDTLRSLCSKYCVVADITFYGLRPKIDYEFYISKSKCRNFEYEEIKIGGRVKRRIKGVFDNGRVVKCSRCTVSVTEIDFDIIDRVYEWDHIEIGACYSYMRGRLPTDLIKIVVDLYKAKNTLKGVKGMEKIYLLKKEDLNSIYGMMVTDLIREIYGYEDDWLEPQMPDLVDKIGEYNKNFSRFTFYPWGVYITAHARRRLWSGILEIGYDYIYGDTDSLKFMNAEKHMDYIKQYNDNVLYDLKRACYYHDIPMSDVMPRTIKGEQKVLGQWDSDGHYAKFKTLGAKRYMRQYDDGHIEITVAGVNPKKGAVYMTARYGGDVFDAFTDGLVIPAEHTGKLTHTYIDEEIKGWCEDYQGRAGVFHELSYVHLSPCEYHAGIDDDFVKFLLGVHEHGVI